MEEARGRHKPTPMQGGSMEAQADGPGRELAAGISRALDDLMASMRGVLERLENGQEAESAGNPAMLVLSARRAVHQGEQLARRMRAYAGLQALTPARLEPLPFLCDMAHTLRQVLDERIDVSVAVDRDCPACHADLAALEEALMHLVSNARDAMPEGGRLQLSARAHRLADGSAMVALSVSDNGAGMSPEFARRAAQPFVTTNSSRAQAGTGLAAVDGFAHQSGGCLTLLPQLHGGMTATLSLPQFRPDPPTAAS